jgi:hypothetical protein
MKIILVKGARLLRNSNPNPKVPPPEWWSRLEELLSDYEVRKAKDIYTSWQEMKADLDWCDVWISVDTYWQHFAWYHDKKGIVVWSKSDPLIFGHESNINVIKDRSYLRANQFDIWEAEPFDSNAFPTPESVVSYV